MKAMHEAGRLGALVNIHAEDQCCISFMTERLAKQGKNHVHGFPESRPRLAEGIAARRAVEVRCDHELSAQTCPLRCLSEA